MKTLILLFTIAYILLASSCKLSTRLWNGGDTSPPLLEQMTITDTLLELYFNEPIQKESIFTVQKEYENIISDISIIRKKMRISLSSTIAGQEYNFETIVYDTAGNSSLIIDNFYGHNNRIPAMLISEFTCKGSKKNGDKVELAVLSDGNTAGIVLQEGVGDNYTIAVTLPALEVKKGDFIVVHFRPYPSQDIKNEITSKIESTHKQAYDSAWDIFSTQDKGISNTNATLTLLTHPKGKIIDAVLYSIKQDKQKDPYYGFGASKAYHWAQQLLDTTEWKKDTNSGEEINNTIATPSLAINPKKSTSTRSISRNTQLNDTNTKKDWHITPTRGATFGKQNTNEEY